MGLSCSQWASSLTLQQFLRRWSQTCYPRLKGCHREWFSSTTSKRTTMRTRPARNFRSLKMCWSCPGCPSRPSSPTQPPRCSSPTVACTESSRRYTTRQVKLRRNSWLTHTSPGANGGNASIHRPDWCAETNGGEGHWPGCTQRSPSWRDTRSNCGGMLKSWRLFTISQQISKEKAFPIGWKLQLCIGQNRILSFSIYWSLVWLSKSCNGCCWSCYWARKRWVGPNKREEVRAPNGREGRLM